MMTSAFALRASASTGSAGALTPSSLLMRIRYGRCCAAAVTRPTATIAVNRKLRLLDAFRGWCRDIEKHEAALHFFHRHAFRLVWMRPMHFGIAVLIEPRARAPSKLLRPQGGDVNEQKPAFTRGRLRPRSWRFEFRR